MTNARIKAQPQIPANLYVVMKVQDVVKDFVVPSGAYRMLSYWAMIENVDRGSDLSSGSRVDSAKL